MKSRRRWRISIVACSDLVVDPSMKTELESERERDKEREIQSGKRPIKILVGPFNVFLAVENSPHFVFLDFDDRKIFYCVYVK